jgi:hypothetical protein
LVKPQKKLGSSSLSTGDKKKTLRSELNSPASRSEKRVPRLSPLQEITIEVPINNLNAKSRKLQKKIAKLSDIHVESLKDTAIFISAGRS